MDVHPHIPVYILPDKYKGLPLLFPGGSTYHDVPLRCSYGSLDILLVDLPAVFLPDPIIPFAT